MQGLSLVGLLVVAAIILIVYANYTSQVASTNAKIRPQVEQLAGVDTSGRRVSDTYTLKALFSGNHLRGVRVETLAPDSPMISYYGLQKDDVITEVGSHGSMMRARDEQDAELYKSLIAQAYQTQDPIVVERGEKTITLKGGAKKPGSSDVDSTLEGLTQPR